MSRYMDPNQPSSSRKATSGVQRRASKVPRPRSVGQPRPLVEAMIRPIRVNVPDVEDEEDIPVMDPTPVAHIPRRDFPGI